MAIWRLRPKVGIAFESTEVYDAMQWIPAMASEGRQCFLFFTFHQFPIGTRISSRMHLENSTSKPPLQLQDGPTRNVVKFAGWDFIVMSGAHPVPDLGHYWL